MRKARSAQRPFGRGGARMRRALCALACVCALAAGMGMSGIAAAQENSPLSVTCESSISLARIDVRELPATTDPQTIEKGIACGMTDMCGQDPCLCGSVDAWGACACNGLETVSADYELDQAAAGVVRLVKVFDTYYVVAVGTGSVDATLTASYPHHDLASTQVHIEVAPFAPLDIAKIIAGLVAILVAVAALVALIRLVVGAVRTVVKKALLRRRLLHQARLHAQQQAEELADQVRVPRMRPAADVAAEARCACDEDSMAPVAPEEQGGSEEQDAHGAASEKGENS